MQSEDIKNLTEDIPQIQETVDDKKSSVLQKKEKPRFEIALYVNDYAVSKRMFNIPGYIEYSMDSVDFLSVFREAVDLIKYDLVAKSRVYLWYHTQTEHPEWEPETMTDPLISEGAVMFRFVVRDGNRDVLEEIWDGRDYPSYVRRNVDLTNRIVRVIKNGETVFYDKDEYFPEHEGMLSTELYILKAMINDRPNLLNIIPKMFFKKCSIHGSEKFEKLSDYEVTATYKNGNAEISLNPSLKVRPSKYDYSLNGHNKRVESRWATSVREKTQSYMDSLYYNPKEKYSKAKRKNP